MERDDLRIKILLKRHLNYTNSLMAKKILNDFDEQIKKFVKVVPIDFEKAIKQSSNNNDSINSRYM